MTMSIVDFLSALMVFILVIEFLETIGRFVEDKVTKKRDETRLMEDFLRADRAELEAKERERRMLMRKKEQMLAVKESGEKLIAEFLEAVDGNKNFDEKDMMDAIEALIGRGGGNGSDVAGFGGVYGEAINYLQDTQNLDDDGTVMATIEGTNGEEE